MAARTFLGGVVRRRDLLVALTVETQHSKELDMSTRNGPHGGVPTSSGKNRFATNRTMVVLIVVVAFLLVAIWVPW